ncbi:hypothetical protein FA13DRAFT_1528046 [Coprinellus micaceus]|uniref:Uncharacterized protein n=1 Tax=Coprinellus micaceus TaxID=71717 RepID=A0A4Y7SJD7_COPMI|nr:hypothetical protein FA13DRAFT_1528046 [Coprinellus micaceus]
MSPCSSLVSGFRLLGSFQSSHFVAIILHGSSQASLFSVSVKSFIPLLMPNSCIVHHSHFYTHTLSRNTSTVT